MKKDPLDIPASLRDVQSYYRIRDSWSTALMTWTDWLVFSVKHRLLVYGLSEKQSVPLLALSRHIQWQRRTRRLIDLGIKHLGSMDPHMGKDLAHQSANLTDFFRLAIVALTRQCVATHIPYWRIRFAYFPSWPRR